ncbi:MAG: LacI family DNA-binding transcriptional regulator [Acidobacteriota bacterium]|nr:LacI family DNA-binding transcriptional regulator [Acidobacteriota bacterium]
MSKRRSGDPTIKDVARLARVALMTVSRVINNQPSVRPATRKRVEAAIAQLGYQQNEAARQLKGQRARIIGLIVPDLSDGFFAICAHTIQRLARQHGFMTLVVASGRDAELEVEQAELMAKRMISGLLLVSSIQDPQPFHERLQRADLPMVAFDRPLAGLKTDAVLVENRAGAAAAVQHLIEHGHTRIACIGYDEEVYTIRERIDGYRGAMQQARLKPMVAAGLGQLDEVRAWLGRVLASKTPPTAIFTLNHRTSAQLYQALAERGVAIPGQVAVVGFDDFDLAPVLNPPLTAVAQAPAELAARSMHLLLERINRTAQGEFEEPAKILLPTSLVVRSSCGKHV